MRPLDCVVRSQISSLVQCCYQARYCYQHHARTNTNQRDELHGVFSNPASFLGKIPASIIFVQRFKWVLRTRSYRQRVNTNQVCEWRGAVLTFQVDRVIMTAIFLHYEIFEETQRRCSVERITSKTHAKKLIVLTCTSTIKPFNCSAHFKRPCYAI